MIYNIKDYGAELNTRKICTQAIQRAIDVCGREDTVLIPEGTYVTGALFLKSNMTLRLVICREVIDFFGDIAYITGGSKEKPNSQVTERHGDHYGNDRI